MHPIIWHLPIAADDPQPSWSHAFPSWFAQQDPKECSEKDKILMLNHFLEHLDEVVKACSSEYFTTSKNYLSSYESEVAQAKVAQDTRIQGEVNKWLSSWNWNETTSLYGDHMCSMFRKQRTQPWLIKALKENPTTQFNSQLLYILDLEYSRSPFVAKDNHLFLKQTGRRSA